VAGDSDPAPPALVSPGRTRVVLSVYHLAIVGGIVSSGSVAWATVSNHVSSGGHKSTTDRVALVEKAILVVEQEQKAEARAVAIQLDGLDRKIDRLMDLAAMQLAADPAAADTPASRRRAVRIRENVAEGSDPFDGL